MPALQYNYLLYMYNEGHALTEKVIPLKAQQSYTPEKVHMLSMWA